jgi:hypothetical protein
MRRNDQRALSARLHAHDAFVPALDHFAAAEEEPKGTPRSRELSNLAPFLSGLDSS